VSGFGLGTWTVIQTCTVLSILKVYGTVCAAADAANSRSGINSFMLFFLCKLCGYCAFYVNDGASEGVNKGVSKGVICYFTDHSESLDMTINLSSSTFDNGHRKATVLVCSEYLGLAPDPCRVPPLVFLLLSCLDTIFFIYRII
jgi:hypothetical protein